jgi:hypothetical protein
MLLKLYERPKYYMGEDFEGYYAFLGRSRDSDHIEQSNFDVGLERLGGESEPLCDCEELRRNAHCSEHPAAVVVQRASHWAVGWVETIYVHQSATDAVALAEDMRESLENYPILDEADHSRREWEAAVACWKSMDYRERSRVLHEHGLPRKLARNSLSYVQDYDDGSLFQYLRGE